MMIDGDLRNERYFFSLMDKGFNVTKSE